MAKGWKIFGYIFWILSGLALIVYISGELTDPVPVSWLEWIKIEDVKMGCLLGALAGGLLAFIFISIALRKNRHTIEKYENRKKIHNEVVTSVGTYVDDRAARRVAKLARKEKERREKLSRKEQHRRDKEKEKLSEIYSKLEAPKEEVEVPEVPSHIEEEQAQTDKLKALFNKKK